MNKNELQSQIDNLKLEFTDAVYSVVAMKVGRGDEKDVLSELAVKQTIKEALEKITRVYEFGMSDNEIFILGSNKKHDVGKNTQGRLMKQLFDRTYFPKQDFLRNQCQQGEN